MAKKSLADLQAQIQKLQAEAEVLKQEEKAGVVARIREAIAAYELTAADLFGAAKARSTRGKRGVVKSLVRHAAYADDHGNVWGGRGPRPRWLREALQQGRALEDFATGGRTSSPSPSETAAGNEPVTNSTSGTSSRVRAAKKGARGAAVKTAAQMPAKYRDDAGNSWSGRGLQPRWLKEALSSGKTLESFRVQS